MTERTSRWDPSLLRKFSSTGHFRLLNQLRGDLRKNPLERDQHTAELRHPGSGSRGTTRRGSVQRGVNPTPVVGEATSLVQSRIPQSFRDRLNAIEMR
ncbi:hypothetical protein [Synechococcus sp. M16CYN]|uniref:hypothetical protein n=1 Tax=Synechococcus sp. M16CYN TaxID=3103139 RepID=UPI003243F0F5